MDRGGTVKHCYIYQCQTLGIGVTDGYGGGVCMENNGALRKSVITNNMARVGGGLMIVYTPEEHPYSTSKYTKDGLTPMPRHVSLTITTPIPKAVAWHYIKVVY